MLTIAVRTQEAYDTPLFMDSPRPTLPPFDDMLAALSLEQIAEACNVEIEQTIGKEVKIACPFGCPGQANGQQPISVNKEGAKLARCHAEMCDMSCNVAYLVYGWLNGKQPTNGKLRGGEFVEVRDFLRDLFERGTEPAETEPLAQSPDSAMRFSTSTAAYSNARAKLLLSAFSHRFLRSRSFLHDSSPEPSLNL